MKSRPLLLLSGISSLAGCDYPTTTKPPAQQAYQVTFYVENSSKTQPATDLLIRWDTTVVAQDTFRYTNVSDQFQTYQLSIRPGEHHIRVVNSMNQLRLDSTIIVRNPLTHVFVGFNYKKLDEADINHIRQMEPPEGVDAVVAELYEPKHLFIHIMEGPISIP
ncbi:hypothetical protein LJ737_13710 [Hymenobacter sp. 15J16-1T3B]|uniref:hypothetical protein n=1 Tax=Hymenobacter sp. 15J16-1T3B TaxID=2886941 RepID=UPI001D12B221|nr:hypothetical protein [Hymenobacter sp. 15J16-1T3B]MCC3158300.1 hypothetical protein [Hymenobacter sp. 15J16-1T3B]